MKGVAELHEVLNVVDTREIYAHELKKVFLAVRKSVAGEHLEHVAEIIARVESDPPHVFIEHDAARSEKLAETVDVHAILQIKERKQ